MNCACSASLNSLEREDLSVCTVAQLCRWAEPESDSEASPPLLFCVRLGLPKLVAACSQEPKHLNCPLGSWNSSLHTGSDVNQLVDELRLRHLHCLPNFLNRGPRKL